MCERLINTEMPPNNLQASGLKVARWKGAGEAGERDPRVPTMRGERRDGRSGKAGRADPSFCDFRPFLFLHAHPLTDSLATAALV